MTALAPTLQTFFTQRLIAQRQASSHTISAYRDSLKLLLGFAAERTSKSPALLQIADLDAPLIGAFLDHLQQQRGNSAATRNARLAAIHSLFRYAALSHPEDAAIIARVLAIPPKRTTKTLIIFLDEDEITALQNAPDRATWTGRRDHALIALACQTGLRATELTTLTTSDIHLGTGAHVSCLGKGRKQRITPLTGSVTQIVRGWLQERAELPGDALFPTRRGTPLTRDALERRLTVHAATATRSCPALAEKKITPHVLRHSTAMRLLRAGVDVTVIALWLGHEKIATTAVYLHADMALKEQALARTAPQEAPPGHYQPTDTVISFLEGL